MSAATTCGTETIFVRLVGEAVDVWRPVSASRLGGDTFRLAPGDVSVDEEWEFLPGEVVRVGPRHDGSAPFLVAQEAATFAKRRVG